MHTFAKKVVPAPVASSIARERGGGSRLPESVAAPLGAGAGHDFSRVHVHADARAADLAASLGARAFTVGHDVFFGAGQYRPHTRDGTKLVAHELVHVAQQGRAPVDTRSLEPEGSPAEREADAMANDLADGRAASAPAAVPHGIPRDAGFAGRGPIPDAYGIGYNEILARAGQGAKGAVLDLASLETPSMDVDLAKFDDLPLERKRGVLALEAHAAGTACERWFGRLRPHATVTTGTSPAPKPTPEQERAGEMAYYQSTRQAQLDSARARVRAELPRLSARDIEARWKGDRTRFIEIASTPDHGLGVEQMLAIYIHYWADFNERARAKQVDLNNRRLGATDEFDRAVREEEFARAALAAVVDAHENLIAAAEIHRSLTIDKLTEFALNSAGFREGLAVLGMAIGSVMGPGAPRPPSSRPPPPPAPAPVTPSLSPPIAGFGRPLAPASPAPPGLSPPIAGFGRPLAPASPAPPALSPPIAGFGRPLAPASPTPPALSPPIAGFGRPLAPAAPAPPALSPPIAGFGRPLAPAAPAPPALSPPIASFGRPLAPAAPAPATPPRGTPAPARPGVVSPGPGRGAGTPPKMSGEEPPSGSTPKIGRVEPVTPQPIDRVGQVREWAKQNKVTGDVQGLQSRLRSRDPATRAAAEAEFEEVAATIRNGGKPHVEEFQDAPPRQAKPAGSRISTAEKSELENSAWLKQRLKSPGDRRKFMDWLKKGHKEGDLGAELKPGDRDAGKHEHLKPGSPEAEAKVREWEAEGKP